MSRSEHRRLLAPEVIQTSAMDCGPAALECLLDGHGMHVGYGRLREACQTEVDGTSIDTMEEVAQQLGLDAEQIMLPLDHLLLDESSALPALVVMRLPDGNTHFAVLWRRHGPLVQVMDPGHGRRWITWQTLREEIYLHEHEVAAADWLEWARSEDAAPAFRRRLSDVGIAGGEARRLLADVAADEDWRPLAALDGAVRLTTSLIESKAVRRGSEGRALVRALYEHDRAAPAGDELVPEEHWAVRPGREGMLVLRAAVLVRVRGHVPSSSEKAPSSSAESGERLSPELAAALHEPPPRPLRDLARMVRADGIVAPSAVLIALFLAAAGTVLEALLLDGLMGFDQLLVRPTQRLAGLTAVVVLILVLLGTEALAMTGTLRLGRHLEVRLRRAFLAKLPGVTPRYFQSRLRSDMAERSHTLHVLRQLPELGAHVVRATARLLATTCGILWLQPSAAPYAIAGAGSALALPLLFYPALRDRDLRIRAHGAALGRFYLDALLGVIPIRAHGAERAMRRGHEELLVAWSRSGSERTNLAATFATVHGLAGFALAGALVAAATDEAGSLGSMLLLAYWALQLPVLGQQIGLGVRQYPTYRSIALRVMEPLGTPEEGEDGPPEPVSQPARTGTSVELDSVTVRAGGHTVLDDVSLSLRPGEQVAIVGPSGGGKSTLVGLLLGIHRPSNGAVRVDGDSLHAASLAELRRWTAWVDPQVQLWNTSLLENLEYGSDGGIPSHPGIIAVAELEGILERRSEGLQSRVGESGGLLSGGEGQRVRFGRALLKQDARLVVLDEAFRGLERARRRELLSRAREQFAGATILCVTHDIDAAGEFDRVLVVEDGRIVEQGAPAALAATQGRYRALLEAERRAHERLWSDRAWRRLTMSQDGTLHEEGQQ